MQARSVRLKCRVHLKSSESGVEFASSRSMADITPMNEIKQVTSVGSSEKLLESSATAVNDNEANLTMIHMFTSWIYPAALRTIVQLNVPQILATNATKSSLQEENVAMTAKELLRQHIMMNISKQEELEAICRPSAPNLERLLRLLTTKGVFAEHIDIVNSEEEDLEGGDHDILNARVVRWFSLTPLSRCLVPGEGSIRNTALLLTLGPECAAALEYLGDTVLKSEEPFTKAHGMNQFEYMKSHPSFLAMFKDAVKENSPQIVPMLLSKYHGFEGVQKLVDVGGSSGKIAAGIVDKYPHIHAINFDLPEVIANNPNLPGVEQVGGDMFEKVPSGCDAIFMKSILHDWNDEQCLKILKNCWAALPSVGGKLIMLDLIMPVETPLEASHPIQSQTIFHQDFIMQICCASGRERTMAELEGLLRQARFTSFRVIGEVGIHYIMEAFK